ncbi:STAS domain-containing protein [Pseudokineococcus marinus]|uniref:STAS domain-containing protein n=1 Tax=Pseudokineococcus marinus TaxID=351215 RepID=A0A849BMZ1_9ACTN|nr:STAS domain-containing protein [Pseudokineococcus marinus]NNH22162.1 STAS domain-containing protein [Pseudokineococcus marinus]
MTAPRPGLTVSLDLNDNTAVLAVTGPLTVASLPSVTEIVDRLLLLAGPRLRVDLHQCTSCDTRVAEWLATTRSHLEAGGGALTLTGRPDQVPPAWEATLTVASPTRTT